MGGLRGVEVHQIGQEGVVGGRQGRKAKKEGSRCSELLVVVLIQTTLELNGKVTQEEEKQKTVPRGLGSGFAHLLASYVALSTPISLPVSISLSTR